MSTPLNYNIPNKIKAMSTDEIDKKIKELESKEHPNLPLINSLKEKKALLKLDKIVRK